MNTNNGTTKHQSQSISRSTPISSHLASSRITPRVTHQIAFSQSLQYQQSLQYRLSIPWKRSMDHILVPIQKQHKSTLVQQLQHHIHHLHQWNHNYDTSTLLMDRHVQELPYITIRNIKDTIGATTEDACVVTRDDTLDVTSHDTYMDGKEIANVNNIISLPIETDEMKNETRQHENTKLLMLEEVEMSRNQYDWFYHSGNETDISISLPHVANSKKLARSISIASDISNISSVSSVSDLSDLSEIFDDSISVSGYSTVSGPRTEFDKYTNQATNHSDLTINSELANQFGVSDESCLSTPTFQICSPSELTRCGSVMSFASLFDNLNLNDHFNRKLSIPNNMLMYQTYNQHTMKHPGLLCFDNLVKEKLHRDGLLNTFNISLSSNNGIVTRVSTPLPSETNECNLPLYTLASNIQESHDMKQSMNTTNVSNSVSVVSTIASHIKRDSTIDLLASHEEEEHISLWDTLVMTASLFTVGAYVLKNIVS